MTGTGVRTVTLAEKATFTKDIKGWQALQVLSPRRVTTKKTYFSVSCRGPAKPGPAKPGNGKPGPGKPGNGKPGPGEPGNGKPDHGRPGAGKPNHGKRPAFVKAYVNVPDHTGACPPSGGITAKGVIKTDRPTVVKYRWIHNGKVAGTGTAKVVRDKKVSFTFTPNKSHKGSVTLDIVSPRHGISGRDAYEVTCEEGEEEPPPPPPVTASATVTAPDNYTGACPITRVFNGTVTVDRINPGGSTVQYRWMGPDYEGPAQTLTFAEGDDPQKSVSLPVEVSGSAGQQYTVQRYIEILSPNSVPSNTAEAQVTCEELRVSLGTVSRRVDATVCGTPGYGPAVTFSTNIQVNGPVRVEYQWEFQNVNGDSFTVPGQPIETDGPATVPITYRLESSPFTASALIRARLRITSHNVQGWVSDFTLPPCTT